LTKARAQLKCGGVPACVQGSIFKFPLFFCFFSFGEAKEKKGKYMLALLTDKKNDLLRNQKAQNPLANIKNLQVNEKLKKHLIRLINRLFEQYCKHFERY
jgi:hypothetical protein